MCDFEVMRYLEGPGCHMWGYLMPEKAQNAEKLDNESITTGATGVNLGLFLKDG